MTGVQTCALPISHLSRSGVQERFRQAMREAWAIGPFSRAAGAHYDETDCVSELFDTALQGAVMIDVGAHHGHALFLFVQKGWKVFAFEPDRSEEHTSELQSLMRISYAVFCLKKN